MAESSASLTPEKKLLRLIEDPQAGEAGGGGKGSKSGGKVPFDFARFFSPSAMQGRIAYLKDNWKAIASGSGPASFSLKQVNMVLKVVILCMGVFFLGNIFLELKSAKGDFNSYAHIPQKEMAEISLTQPKIFDESFFDEVARRNIFIPSEKREEVKKPKSGVYLKLLEISQQLRLVGISLRPERPKETFCMIEDLKKNMTSFLKVGDSISGLTVEKIYEDNVVLAYADEKIELR